MIKAVKNPPETILLICKAVLCFFGKDPSEDAWKQFLIELKEPHAFIAKMRSIDVSNITIEDIEDANTFIKDLTEESVKAKSASAF